MVWTGDGNASPQRNSCNDLLVSNWRIDCPPNFHFAIIQTAGRLPRPYPICPNVSFRPKGDISGRPRPASRNLAFKRNRAAH